MIKKKKTTRENQNDRREHLNKKNLLGIGFHIWRQFDDPYYTGFAAQIAYFFFMASMPTMIVLSQLLGVFDVSLDFIKAWLEKNLTSNISNFVLSLLSAPSVKLTNVFMIILALWAASSLEFSLARLTSYTLTEGSYRFNFWSERIKAIPTALLSLVAVAFTLVIFVYGENLFSTFTSSPKIAKVLLALRVPIVIGLFFAMLLMNYYILPRVRVPLRCVIPGAIVACAGIMIITFGYAFYISYIANYNILYGAFANMVALMLWFYLISWVLCIGMMFNKAWDDVMKKNRLTKDKMVEYLEKQMGGEEKYDYKKFIVMDEDKGDPENMSIAMKMSKQFVDGYDPSEDKAKRAEAEEKASEEEKKMSEEGEDND